MPDNPAEEIALSMVPRFKSGLLPIIILLVGLGPILVTVLTPRDFSLNEQFDVGTPDPDLAAFGVSRLIIAITLALSVAVVFRAMIRGRLPKAGFGVWFAYVIYFVTNVVITAIAGRVPDFNLHLFYGPLVLTAVYMAQPMSTERLVTLSKGVLLFYVYGSILAAVFAPDWALVSYAGYLPGIDLRLFGVGFHPLILGMLTAGYVALEIAVPGQSRLRGIHLLAAIAVIVLAQSKTSWIFVLLFCLYLMFRKAEQLLFRGAVARAKSARYLFSTFGVVAGVVVIGLAVSMIDLGLGSYEQGQIETLTGRIYIWKTTLATWRDNPLFGYGLGLWDSEFQFQYGYFSHAHNQFLHALGSSGIVGLAGLLVYLWIISVAAIRAAGVDRVPLVIFGLVVVYSITEVPLRNTHILHYYFFIHLLLFAHLTQAMKQANGRKSPLGLRGASTSW